MNTYNLKLDLNKGPTYGVGMAYSGITLRQGDKRGCTVVAELYDHGTRFTESGYTAYFVMGLPDREHYYREAATYNAGTATIIIDESLAASVAGDTVAYFELTKGGATYSTQGIKVSVLKDARADKTPGETYDSRIEQAIEELETAIAQAETQIEADVAEWLDEHPEATTTVQDGSITYAKLHSSTKQRLGNRLHRALTAPVVAASDAYAAPPVALVVDGKSVQDGTPTPDAPVAIQSVESVGLGAAGVNLLPFPAARVDTGKGITLTDNGDGSYTISGTVTSASDAYIYVTNNASALMLGEGTYTLTLRDGSGNLVSSGIRLYCSKWVNGSNTPLFNETSGRRTFAWDGEGNFQVTFQIPRNTTVSEITVYPQLELGSTATPYQPYVGSTTPIPLQGHALRSLPDGTHDELRVDADGNVTLVRRTGHVSADTLVSASKTIVELADVVRISYARVLEDEPSRSYNGDPAGSGWCNVVPYVNNYTLNAVHAYAHNAYAYIFAPKADKSTWDATTATEWTNEHAPELVYALATPVTHDLGAVTLPSMPAPDMTAWASCTPATEIELDYERSVTIAVERLEAAIAELATN